ncbi:hypothetical protein MMC29_000855 [Sticta canariensis]|nr:hypothetical protein [Sticta canariensis]
MTSLLLGLSAALCTWTLTGIDAFTCRQGPASATQHCGLPVELSNFQGDLLLGREEAAQLLRPRTAFANVPLTMCLQDTYAIQSYYACEEEVQLGRPENKQDILSMISYYDKVKGVGIGHSWWQQQFCSGNDSLSINIVTTELNTTLALILNPTYPIDAPPDFPIQVNEATQTVTAQAGVPQRILLDYLAKHMYKTPGDAHEGFAHLQLLGLQIALCNGGAWHKLLALLLCPEQFDTKSGTDNDGISTHGLLPAGLPMVRDLLFQYIDQTIGGAVSTGTHGSSLWYGSLASQHCYCLGVMGCLTGTSCTSVDDICSFAEAGTLPQNVSQFTVQVVRIEMALANATLANLTEASNPHLWHAAQTSVGRLGIITEVELMIKPQSMIKRSGYMLSFNEFVAQMRQLQANWTGALAGTNGLTIEQVQDAWEATQVSLPAACLCLRLHALGSDCHAGNASRDAGTRQTPATPVPRPMHSAAMHEGTAHIAPDPKVRTAAAGACLLFWFVPDGTTYKVQYSDLGPAPVEVGSVTTQSVGQDEPEMTAANPSVDRSLGGPATALPPSQAQASTILAAEGFACSDNHGYGSLNMGMLCWLKSCYRDGVLTLWHATGRGPQPEDVFAQVPTPELGPSKLFATQPL